MAQAQLTVAINGNKQLTDFLSDDKFDVAKKLEYDFYEFLASDGVITLPISKLVPISKIIANSSGNLNIKCYTDSTVYETNISGVYYNCLDPLISPNISGITIETTNTDIGVNGFISIVKTV